MPQENDVASEKLSTPSVFSQQAFFHSKHLSESWGEAAKAAREEENSVAAAAE